MRILIVKLGSIGDIVHTLPSLAAIKKSLPNAKVSWVVENRSAEILKENQLLENLIIIDTKFLRETKSFAELQRQKRLLKVENFDIAIDFQGLIKSAFIAKISGAKKRFGFARKSLREPLSRFALTNTFEVDSGINIIEKNLTLLKKSLGIVVPANAIDFEFPIFTNQSHKDEAAGIIQRAGENFTILNPAAGWKTKLWSAENFGKLADKLFEEKGLTTVLTFAGKEESLAERVIAASTTKKIVKAKLSLKGFYELAKRAKIYVGGDTGPTHLAVAAKCPVVGIFGPTEWWRNGSPFPDDICVGRTDIDCRVDCHRRTCGKWICMDIDVQRVFRAVETRLKMA